METSTLKRTPVEPVAVMIQERMLIKSWVVAKCITQSIIPIDREEETEAREELKQTIRDLVEKSQEGEFKSAIKLAVGRVLAGRLPLDHIVILGNAIWDLAKETEDKRYIWALSDLKKKTIEIFRMVLSGGDEVCSFEDGEAQYYSLSPIPGRLKTRYGITFAVSRRNTDAIIKAYDELVEDGAKASNQSMVQKWTIEKEIFLKLIKRIAPKLLEPAPALS